MVGATHGKDAFELVQNLFRFHVMEYVFEGQKYVSVLHLGDQVCQVFQLETGFKAALRIIPCCDLMGEIEGFEHSFSEAI